MDDELANIVRMEMTRAEHMLLSMAGETIDTVTVNSHRVEDATFLALNVSKLSPIIGNLLERRIIELLIEGSEHGLRWVRQDPDFPDALLVDGDGESTGNGYEVKAWYALSTEITGRFRESSNLLASRNVRVVTIAWMMDHIVYGVPTIIDVLVTDAASVAAQRDLHYHQPPRYLTVEPQDTTKRTRNLQQTNVSGYRIQEFDRARLAEAAEIARAHVGYNTAPHSPETQALNAELMSRFTYRLDTNFAKMDRIDHPEIERFKTGVLDHQERGRSISSWIRLLKDLDDEKRPIPQQRAIQEMLEVYNT